MQLVPIAFDGFNGRLAHLGIGGQAQVVVGAAHDESVPAEDRLCPFVAGQRDEVGIHACGNSVFRLGIAIALVEKTHE